MRAIVVHGAGDLRIEQREPVVPGPGEVQIAIAYAGICGSDLHYYRHGRVGAFVVREPLVVGHEVVGLVVADGRALSGNAEAFAVGTPVTLHPATLGQPLPGLERRPSIWPGGRYLGSAATWPHTQGAMCDLFTARADQIRVLPAELPLKRAVLAEPLGVALHALHRAGTIAGKTILVSGAGPIGLLVAGAANAMAAEVSVADVLAEPLATAQAVGAVNTLRVGVDQLPNQAYDVVLECSGAPAALDQAIRSVVSGGTVVQVGILPGEPRPYTMAELISREIDLRGSYRFDGEINLAVELLAANPGLGQVVSDIFDVADAAAAFEHASDARKSSKVALRFHPEEYVS